MSYILLVDSNHLLHRVLHTQWNLATSTGIPSGGVFGFVQSLRTTLNHFYDVSQVISVWDSGYSVRRAGLYPSYKANRQSNPDDPYRVAFREQRIWLNKLLPCMGVVTFSLPNKEADDILYRMTRDESQSWLIMSEDKDMWQAITHKSVYVWRPIAENRAPGTGLITSLNYRTRVGIPIGYYPFLKALLGDPSDNVANIPGVGYKTALTLVNQMQTPTLEELRAVAARGKSKLTKRIIDMWSDVVRNHQVLDLGEESFNNQELEEIQKSIDTKIDFNEMSVVDIFQQLEFNSILEGFQGWTLPFRRVSR